nr:MAG: replication initiator protein [Microvirus sp.]
MECMTPFYLKEGLKEGTPVPCGKCPNCRKRRVSQWSFRLMMEDKRSVRSRFITFTYDVENVPISEKGFMTLRKRDYQLFMKRLRKEQGKVSSYPIKFFCVGEYGGKFNRPHFHAIVFNILLDKEAIAGCWKQGMIHVGEVSGASVGYCLKYMMKPSRISVHQNDDRVKEFMICSKRLGDNYLTEAIRSYHRSDILGRCFLTTGGIRISMPRYYKNKLYDEMDKVALGVAAVSRKFSVEERTPEEEREYNEAKIAEFVRMNK